MFIFVYPLCFNMQNKYSVHVILKNEVLGNKTSRPGFRSYEYVTHSFKSKEEKLAFVDELAKIREEQLVAHGLKGSKAPNKEALSKFAKAMKNVQSKISPAQLNFRNVGTFYLPPNTHSDEFEIGTSHLRIPRSALTHKDVFSKPAPKPAKNKGAKTKSRLLGMVGSFFSTK